MHHKRQSRNRVAGVSFVTGLPCGWLGSESESVFESVDRFKVEIKSHRGGRHGSCWGVVLSGVRAKCARKSSQALVAFAASLS